MSTIEVNCIQLKYNTSLSTIEVNCTPAEVQHITVNYWSQQPSSCSTTHHCQLLKSTALQAEVQHITVNYWSQLHSSWSTTHHCQLLKSTALQLQYSQISCQLLKSTALQLKYNTSLSAIEVNSTPAAEVQHITVNYWSQQHFSWSTTHHCQLLKSTALQLKYNTSLSALQLKYSTSLSTIEVQQHSSWSTTHHCQLLKSTALQLKYNTSLSTIEVNCTPAEVQHITVRLLKSTALQLKYNTSLSTIEVNSTSAEVQHITVSYWSQQHSSWSTTHHCQLNWLIDQDILQAPSTMKYRAYISCHRAIEVNIVNISSWVCTTHQCQLFEVNCTPAEVQIHHCQLLKSTALQLKYNTSLSTIEVNSTSAEVTSTSL